MASPQQELRAPRARRKTTLASQSAAELFEKGRPLVDGLEDAWRDPVDAQTPMLKNPSEALIAAHAETEPLSVFRADLTFETVRVGRANRAATHPASKLSDDAA
jgi:hypothetical protein